MVLTSRGEYVKFIQSGFSRRPCPQYSLGNVVGRRRSTIRVPGGFATEAVEIYWNAGSCVGSVLADVDSIASGAGSEDPCESTWVFSDGCSSLDF